ncbi:MAG: M28 family peptidase [Maribacter sp.]
MKYSFLLIFGLLMVGCGSTKVEETTVLNPTNNPKGVQGRVVEDVEDNTTAEEIALGSSIGVFSTPTDIEKLMVFLTSDELQGRDTGSEGIEKAAGYIEDIFKSTHIAPYFSTYRDTLQNYDDGIAYNMVGYLPGTDATLKNEFVILGAHYDHIGLIDAENGDTIANGANDNASGTSTVLELARFFGNQKMNKRSIIFALFTAEEKGLMGSKHLAEKLKEQGLDLYTMLNFEMVGVPMQNKDHSLYLTGYELSNLAEVSNAYAGKNLVGFLPKAKEFNLFRRSDNAPFHDVFNVPSQTFSSFDFTNFGEYHKVGDEAAKMDFNFMATIVDEVIPVVSGIVNAPVKEILYK